MCGVAGILCRDPQVSPQHGLLAAMGAALSHRGPDQSGEHAAPGIGLAHRRLAIIDLAGGRQPMRSADGRWALSYNGEIYNFRQIRAELEAEGAQFQDHSDTAVLLEAWRAWGAACLDRFIGMFAFALWDGERRELHLVRDRLGIKPLYYGRTRRGDWVFGSELKALLVHPELGRELDPAAVEDYLALGYVPDPRSILTAVESLPPGCRLRLRAGDERPALYRWWDLEPAAQTAGDAGRWGEELRALLDDAVRLRMIADVPLGAFLSGGVDSSTVVALMSRAQTEPVRTCAIGFDDPDYDETAHARAVAQRFHADHEQAVVHPDGAALFRRLAAIYDAPFADASAMPTLAVCELARRRVTVALSGDGGDEALAGYRRHVWHLRESRLRARLPRPLRRLAGMLGAIYPKADWAPRPLRAKTTLQALARDEVAAYFHTVSVIPAEVRARLGTPAFARALQGHSALEVFRGHAARADTDDPLRLAQYLDFKTWLPGDILTKVDRASMAHALEVRVPLLDHRFVAWAFSLPESAKIHGGEGKFVLKRAMEPELPKDILYRRKQGFSVPLRAWFRGPLVPAFEAVLGDSPLLATGWFERDALAGLLREHRAGVRDHGRALWSLLMLDASLTHLLSMPAFSGGGR